MLEDLLPENFDSLSVDELEGAARQATKTGNFARASAMLAKGYEQGGPVAFMDQAYTYAHYLIISRRMLRRSVEALEWSHGDSITENFSMLQSDAIIDRLIAYFEKTFPTLKGDAREPSGSMLLMAEMKAADGGTMDEIRPFLPQSQAISERARLVEAQCLLNQGDRSGAIDLLGDPAAGTPAHALALRAAADVARLEGRNKDAADLYNKGLFAALAPISSQSLGKGQLSLVSTIMDEFDVYAHSDGIFVVHKQPKLVGVTMIGNSILQVMRTPGYRQWTVIKRILGRFVDINRITALMAPRTETEQKTGLGIGTILLQRVYRAYDRFMRNSAFGAYRPALKTFAMGICRPVATIGNWLFRLVQPVLSRIRALFPGKRRITSVLGRTAYRLILLKWIKAEEVPVEQRTTDPQEIFKIIIALKEGSGRRDAADA